MTPPSTSFTRARAFLAVVAVAVALSACTSGGGPVAPNTATPGAATSATSTMGVTSTADEVASSLDAETAAQASSAAAAIAELRASESLAAASAAAEQAAQAQAAAAQAAAEQAAAAQAAADAEAERLAAEAEADLEAQIANGWYTPSGNWISPETAARAVAAGISPGETVPNYLRCGTICGEGPTSGEVQFAHLCKDGQATLAECAGIDPDAIIAAASGYAG